MLISSRFLSPQGAVADFKKIWLVTKSQLAETIYPVLTRFTEKYTNLLINNKEQVKLISDRISTFVDTTIPKIIDFGRGFIQLSSQITASVSHIVEMFGGWETAGKIISGLIGIRLVASAFSFTSSIVKAGSAIWSFAKTAGVISAIASRFAFLKKGIGVLSLALRSVPIVGFVSLMTTGAVLIYSKWDKLKEKLKSIKDYFAGIFSRNSKAVAHVKKLNEEISKNKPASALAKENVVDLENFKKQKNSYLKEIPKFSAAPSIEKEIEQNNSYTINIYGSQGQDARTLADEVIKEIERRQAHQMRGAYRDR